MSEDKYFKPSEIAARWKVSKRQVYTLIKLGKLRGRKLGAIRVSEHDLLQYERISAL